MAEKKKTKVGTALVKFVKILFGLLLIAFGASTYIWWWKDLLTMIKAFLGIIIILVGLVVVIISWEE